MGTFPTQQEITLRAHALFLEGGRHITDIPRYWQQAEKELLDIAARRALRLARRPWVRRQQRPKHDAEYALTRKRGV